MSDDSGSKDMVPVDVSPLVTFEADLTKKLQMGRVQPDPEEQKVIGHDEVEVLVGECMSRMLVGEHATLLDKAVRELEGVQGFHEAGSFAKLLADRSNATHLMKLAREMRAEANNRPWYMHIPSMEHKINAGNDQKDMLRMVFDAVDFLGFLDSVKQGDVFSGVAMLDENSSMTELVDYFDDPKAAWEALEQKAPTVMGLWRLFEKHRDTVTRMREAARMPNLEEHVSVN